MKKKSTISLTSILLWLVVVVLAVFFVLLVVNGVKNGGGSLFKKTTEATQPPLVFVPSNTESTPAPTAHPTVTPTPTAKATLPGGVGYVQANPNGTTKTTPPATKKPVKTNTVTGTIPQTGPGEVTAGLLAAAALATFGIIRTQQVRMNLKRTSRSIDVV